MVFEGIKNLLISAFFDYCVRKDIIMLNKEDFVSLSKEIKSGFGLRRKFLFIGRSFQKFQLPMELCRQNWSAVITTSDSEELLGFFAKSDRTIVCVDNANIKIEPNTEDMPVIFIHKIDESSEWYSEDSFSDTLGDVMRKLGGGGIDVLYTVGLYSNEFDINKLCRRIPTYLMGQKNSPSKTIPNLKVYEEELAAFFAELDSTNDDFEQIVTDENIFYKNGKHVSLSDEDLMQTRRFLILATSGIVEENRPIGDKQLTMAFENFLKLSPTDGPQWYGYIPETKFNVKRPFEDALVNVVTKALSGETPDVKTKYDPTKPIVLMGPPASSKSITLGSLAYRIFAQHNNPVIFIKNYDIDFADDNNFELLDDLMRKIDDLDGDAKSLLIWDGSSNKNTLAVASSLANKLHNRGRKFVMVCSSYQYNLGDYTNVEMCFDNKKQNWTSWNDNIHKDSSLYIHLQHGRHCLIINSNRRVTSGEIAEIKDRYKKYVGIDIDKDNLHSLLDGGTNGEDIFMYFYHLAYFLRNPLEKGLKDERSNISQMYDKELREIFKKKAGSRLGDIYPEFFKQFGLSTDDLNADGEWEYPEKCFKRFQECIALFSQFKIKTPRGLAMALLDINNPNVSYSTENEKIYRFVEEDIPWIRCAATNGELFFEFRNTEEASLYIQEQFKSVDGYKECMDLILSLFDTYMDYDDPSRTVVKCFSELLKELGPNREWELYSGNQFSAEFSNYFKEHMEEVINKLDEVIKARLDYEYSLTLNEITLCREYYGDKTIFLRCLECHNETSKCVQKYEENMDKLAKTIFYTDGRIKEIETQSYTYSYKIPKKQMITELANCNVALLDRQLEYHNYCKENNVTPSAKWNVIGFKSNFYDLFDELTQIISSDPRNGYFYNAVFKIYERYKETTTQVNYDILNRLENIIENSIIIDIIANRGANGRDEFGEHISKIKEEMCDTNVTLDGVLNNSDDIANFLNYHNKMLEKEETSSICFVANTELLRNNIIGQDRFSCKTSFTKNDLRICKKVRDYMMADKIFEIVKKDQNALRLLFRVCWICSAKKDPYSDLDREWLTTKMNCNQWMEINDICKHYIDVCEYKNIEASYFINYIYALSTVQIALISNTGVPDGFKRCYKIIDKLSEKMFVGAKRMRVPFLICNADGEAFTFNFKVQKVKKDNHGIMVMSNPNLAEDIKFRARSENIERKSIPVEGTYIENLAVGLSYTSFSVYKKNSYPKGGRK